MIISSGMRGKKKLILKSLKKAKCTRLMPVILATWEAEIRRILA
jgi:hypothetical protein